MNILLYQPDIKRENASIDEMYPCLGINLLSTVLNQNGHFSCVIDPFKEALITRNTGNDIKEIIKQIIFQNNIQLVGISAILQTRCYACEIAKLVKLIDKNIKIVLGGAGASLIASQLLIAYKDYIDIIVLGEGEKTFLELINAIEKNESLSEIAGLAYLNPDNNKYILLSKLREPIRDLDSVPFPDYSHYMEYLPNGKIETATILTSRGCPYECTYCGTNALWGTVRYRSAKNVFEEIKYLHEHFGVDKIRISDDTFGSNNIQTKTILESIIKYRINVKLYVHSRVDVITREILTLFKLAGGESIYYGVESGSQRLRHLMGKYSTNEEILDICQITKELKIKLGLYLMFGYPNETLSDIRKTYNLIKAIDPDEVYCSIAKIQIGTQLYQDALKKDIIKNSVWVEDNSEYFTFLNKEDEKMYIGCELIFYEQFNKTNIRSGLEYNNDLIYLNQENISFYKEKAMGKIFKKDLLKYQPIVRLSNLLKND